MVKTSLSNAGGAGSIPSQGAKNPHALWPKKIKQKQYSNKFNKKMMGRQGLYITFMQNDSLCFLRNTSVIGVQGRE